MATLITNQGIVRVDDNSLMHWAKGSEAKNHKWIKRFWTGKGWKYQYKQASDKAKNLGNRIEADEQASKVKQEFGEAYERSSRINSVKAKHAENHYDYYQSQIGNRRKPHRSSDYDYSTYNKVDNYNKAAKRDAGNAKYFKEEANKDIREKEDYKRQQASALAAAQRAESKSLKSKAKKTIKNIKKIKNGDFILYSDKITTQFSDEKRPTTLSITDTYANGKKKVRYKKHY